jgi:predicted Zn-dependent peptidase
LEQHVTTLANGLRVIAIEMPHLHSAEIAIYLKVGGRCDPPGKAGLSHFLEHMLFRGTSRYPTTLALETAFEAIGGNVNAATDAETTCFYSRVHPSRIPEGLRLFASMLREPTLEGIDVEKRIIAEEALEDINEEGVEINPENITSRLIWPDTPLSTPTVGTMESIEAITTQDLAAHLATWYVPANMVVAVAGRVDHRQVFESAQDSFGEWPPAQAPPLAAVSCIQQQPRWALVHNPDSQVDLQIAFRGLPRTDPAMMSARILRRLLAGGGSSRLHLLLREELGMVYAVEAGLSAFSETGSFSIDLSTAAENLPRAVESVLAECSRIAREPVPAPELERVRQGHLFDLEFCQDSAYEMANRASWGEVVGMRRTLEEEAEEVRRVTAEHLTETARALFHPANLNLVMVGPVNTKVRDRVEELLMGHRLQDT